MLTRIPDINDFMTTVGTLLLWWQVRMRYVAAYLLAVLGGNENPSAADIKKILSSVGIDAEDDKLKKVIGELNGKNIQELIVEGIYVKCGFV